MAMQFAGVTASDISKTLTEEGLGVAGGVVTGGIIGAQFESRWGPAAYITTTDKLKGWAVNNIPKLAAWALMRKYDFTSEITQDATKGLVGSVVLDSVIRIANGGLPPAPVYLGTVRIMGDGRGPGVSGAGSADVQALMNENNVLKSELNKAMRQLTQANVPAPFAGYNYPVGMMANPQFPGVNPYEYLPPGVGPASVEGARLPATRSIPVSDRQRFFGFMPGQIIPPTAPVEARHSKFGFMQEQAAGVSALAAACGMK